MIKKNFIALGMIAVIVIGMISCVEKKSDEIKIGVVLPLSNSEISVRGKRTLQGIELAVNQYQKENQNTKIKLHVEDSEADPTKGVSAINKLIFQDGIKYILGDLTSSVTLAMAPIAEKNKVIILAPGASNPNIRNAGDYIFRNWTSDDFEGSVSATYIHQRLGWKNLIILYINNDYGIGLSNVFDDKFKKLGGHVIAKERFTSGQTDFKTLFSRLNINKIPKDSIDAIYIAGEPKEMGYIIKRMKELNINLPIFSNSSVEESDFQTIAKNIFSNIYYTTPVFNLKDTTRIISNFVKDYIAKYQQTPDITSAHGFDAAILLLNAIDQADMNNTTTTKTNLYNTKNFEGITGLISFDSLGDVIKPVAVKHLYGGKNEFVEIYNELK